MSSTEVHPVIVVGGGPAGLTASILLSRAGVEHVLVERETLPAASPRAHVINQRTMEIFRETVSPRPCARPRPPIGARD